MTAFTPVRLEERTDELWAHRRKAVKAEVEASLGQTAQELEQAVLVGRRRRAKP
jgi:hypothetical protein